jgi:glycosyltransferase involved in cell wall biosynthesis
MEIERVLFLQPQPCIRALKYARGLRHAPHSRISIVFGYLYHRLNVLYGHGDETFDRVEKLRIHDLENHIKKLVERYRPQVVHSHNAPDFLTISAIEAVGDAVPIIHDCHDVLSLRKTGYYVKDDDAKILDEYPRQEKIANEASDGRIYVSEGVGSYIQQRYDVNPERDRVFPNYISESMMPQRFAEKLSANDRQTHIVYIGTITSLIEGCLYDLREIFKEMANRKVHIHFYVSLFGLADEAYKVLAAENRFIHHHGHLDQRSLLQEITQYDYGWAGFNTNTGTEKHIEVAFPNKIIEYLACGLPVLTFSSHKTVKKFIEDYQVGFVFNDLDEMVNQLGDSESARSLRGNVLGARYQFTVEKKIETIVDFYKELCTSAL